MSKFNNAGVRTNVHAPITAVPAEGKRTFEGAQAFSRDAKSELFVLAVANMVSEKTFYERPGQRDERFEKLVAQVAVEDPQWMARFLPWLRDTANMRSASLVAGLEGARALGIAGCDDPLVRPRQMVAAVLLRPDEPAEALAYWLSRHGRRIPKGIKRGIADAARRHYTQKMALKYDAGTHADQGTIGFADVIEMVHPVPRDAVQSALFGWLLDRRRGATRKVRGKNVTVPEALKTVTATREVRKAAAEDASILADAETLAATGITWEEQRSSGINASSSRADKAALWEAKIPTMGYMALLRNLRGFDEAGVSDAVAQTVANRIADPAEVAASRQFPFRFLSAYKAVESMRWGPALETALSHSLVNVPALKGRTLILVDQSGSMHWTNSAYSKVTLAQIAAIFGSALALRADHARLVQYGDGSEQVKFAPGVGSILRVSERFRNMGGTNTAAAVAAHYHGHDRVIIITDEQAAPYRAGYNRMATPSSLVPKFIPVYTWNLAGYEHGHDVAGEHLRYTFAGLTDQAWNAIELLEAGHDGDWPF